eukprot:6175311-Pleurochrysis_carterae.AAC.2
MEGVQVRFTLYASLSVFDDFMFPTRACSRPHTTSFSRPDDPTLTFALVVQSFRFCPVMESTESKYKNDVEHERTWQGRALCL